jgi:hypothetical protein
MPEDGPGADGLELLDLYYMSAEYIFAYTLNMLTKLIAGFEY